MSQSRARKTANRSDQFDVAGAHGVNQEKNQKRAAANKPAGNCAPQAMPTL